MKCKWLSIDWTLEATTSGQWREELLGKIDKNMTWKILTFLLTVHLSKFISVINQLDAPNFCFKINFISCLYMFRALCAHHQEVKITLHSLWYHHTYTGCPRRKGPNFGRVFRRSNYTDITQNTYIQSSMVTEILAREKCGCLLCMRTVVCPWRHTSHMHLTFNAGILQ